MAPTFKDEFKRIVRENINRPGIEELMDWLEDTDFYTGEKTVKM